MQEERTEMIDIIQEFFSNQLSLDGTDGSILSHELVKKIGKFNKNTPTIQALIARIRELEEENKKLRECLVYNWLNGGSDE